MPKFSVVIPVYNVAPYLTACLDSVLSQTFDSWEAICVDDGSKDESGAILDEYAKKDKRFCVIHQENAGVSTARNVALNVVRGAWVLFLDPDDLWRFDLLANVNNSICKFPNVDFVKFRCKCFEHGSEFHTTKITTDDSFYKELTASLSFALGMDSHFFEFAYRSNLISRLRFRADLSRGEDMLFKCKFLLQNANTFTELDGAYYGYRQRPDSAMHKQMSRRDLVSELIYRAEILCLSASGSRRIEELETSDWIDGFLRRYFFNEATRFDRREYAELMKTWFSVLPRLVELKDIPNSTHRFLLISNYSQSACLTRFLTIDFNGWLRAHTQLFRRIYRFIRRRGEFANRQG